MGNSDVKGVVMRSVLLTVAIMLGMGFYGVSVALHSDTLINGWIPLGIAAVAGVTSAVWGWRLWRRLTDSDTVWINFLLHAAFATGLALFALYALNYYCADSASEREVQAVVAEKYTETRHRTERAGRRVYRQGAPYKVYFIRLDLPDGRSKVRELARSSYMRVHKGDTVDLSLRRGLLGIPVIRG